MGQPFKGEAESNDLDEKNRINQLSFESNLHKP